MIPKVIHFLAPYRRALLVAALLFSGTFQALMSAPFNWWPLAPVYLVPGFWAISQLRGKWALLGGWLMGMSANVTIFYWLVHTIGEFSNLPVPAAIALLGLFGVAFGFYCGLFAWGFHWVRRAAGHFWPLGVAAWWVACEFLNPQLFPYYQGVIFYQVPSIFLLTSITGVAGVTFQIVLWNLVLLWGLEHLQKKTPLTSRPLLRMVAVTLVLLTASVTFSKTRLGEIDRAEAATTTRRIALVQSNLDVRSRSRLARQGPNAVLDYFLEMCRRALAEDPSIEAFVWAEGDLMGSPQMRRNAALLQFVEETGVEIWTGGDYAKPTPDGLRSTNSAYRVYGAGEVDERYDKNILLPFGEFMPLRDVFPILKKIQGVGNFIPGEGLVRYESESGRFCFLICYEAIRHRYVREGVRAGVDLLVNITYDAWFGDTTCPAQHLMLSAIQSAQYGVPLVRAATTGISAFVDIRGVITHRTRVFTPDVLVADVSRAHLPTVYAAVGDVFAWLCVVGALALVVRGRFFRTPSGAENT